MIRFLDRRDAGRRLAPPLGQYAKDDPIVLALPRGGVPVAYEVARALLAPLALLIVRKIGVPGHPELAAGALAGGRVWLNEPLLAQLGLRRADLTESVARARRELAEYAARFPGGAPPPLAGRTVILVDDGLATGASARVALQALRREHPERVLLAVPVAAADSVVALAPETDGLLCLDAPTDFEAVGVYYDDFRPVADDEVRALLAAAAAGFDERRPRSA